MKRLMLFALVSGISIGCYSTLDSFDKRMAKLACINAQECQAADFAATYDSIGDCTDDAKADLDVAFSGCTYDASRGRDCVHAVYKRRKDCGLFDTTSMPECAGVVTCAVYATDNATLTRHIVHSFVTPGIGAPGDVPLDDAIELDAALDEALADL